MEERTDLLEAFRAGWWLVPVVVVATLGSVAYLNSDETPPAYRTTVTLAVVPHPSIENEIQVLRSIEVLERRTMVSTLSRIPGSGIVRGKAAARLGTSMPDPRAYGVRTSIVPGTHLIRVAVQGPDPDLAARFARAIAEVVEEDASAYYRVFGLKVLDDAGVPGQPIERGTGRAYAVAGLLGLFLGIGAALALGLVRVTGRFRPAVRTDAGHGQPKPAS